MNDVSKPLVLEKESDSHRLPAGPTLDFPPARTPKIDARSNGNNSQTIGNMIVLSSVPYLSDQSKEFSSSGLEAKRVVDLVLATILIVALAPVFLSISIVLLSTGGRPLYRHERVGRFGVKFSCLKFRTMKVNADEEMESLLSNCSEAQGEWKSNHKLRNDPRVTAFGKFLRLTSLDEIPQFFNVLRGEMSLVGPRPIVTDEIEKYGSYFKKYTSIRPGITGLWQVSGRNDLTYRKRVALDVCYVQKRSFCLDILILLKTVKVVLQRAGAY